MNRSDPRFTQAILTLRARKHDMSEERREHACDARVCNPECDTSFPCVYLCRYGSVHICTADECEYYSVTQTQTCPASGIQHGTITSSFTQTDSRTWYSKIDVYGGGEGAGGGAGAGGVDPKPVRSFHRVVPEEELKERASALVKLLLFSRHRVTCNNAAIAQHQQEANESTLTYHRQQEGARQFPYWTDIYRLNAHFASQPLPFVLYEFNQNIHDYYVSICCQVWHKALRFYAPPDAKRYDVDGVTEISPRLDFETLCLGVLYSMRQGRKARNLMLLPRDDFLLANLPICSELPQFGIERNRINKGEKIVSQTYENALAANAAAHEITIDVAKLPAIEEEEEEQEVGVAPQKPVLKRQKILSRSRTMLWVPK
jgi:hypothetical protein